MMADFRPLFSPGQAESPAYGNLRDMATPEAREGKEFAEQLWTQYYPYADANFLTEIRRDFHARFWEMYLTCTLLQQGQQHDYSVSCPKYETGGPDICVEHGDLRIWIEAITATDGDPTKGDSVIKPKLDQEYIVPDEKIILRYTTAIYDKHKKYLEYRAKSTEAKNDAYVIAVNGFPLAYRGTDSKRILKAVFPIGPLEYSFNNAEIRYQFRPIIYKNTGGKVSTEFFINNQYCGISAVLHSYANAGMTMVPLGIDFLVVHNPMALRPVPHRLIAATREYWATPVDSEYMELSVTTSPNKTNSHTAARTLSDILEEISNNRRYRGK